MDLREYLRDEFLEEARLGIIDEGELERSLALFDGNSSIASDTSLVAKNETPNGSSPASIAESDPSIVGLDRTIDTEAGPLDVYIVRPKAEGRLPGMVLIHENQGLVPHIRDVARRLAKVGYIVIAPDLLSLAGGVAKYGDAAERSAALGTLESSSLVTQLVAAFAELADRDDVKEDSIGALGFCFGGGMTWLLATREPRLKAAVPFYGPIPPLEAVPDIEAAVLGLYGALDDRITGMIPTIEPAMAAAGKSYEKEIYEGAGHAFYNDDKPDRYNADVATRAWARAMAFLGVHLGS